MNQFQAGWTNRTQILANNQRLTSEGELIRRLQEKESIVFVLDEVKRREYIFRFVQANLRIHDVRALYTSFELGYKGMILDIARQLGKEELIKQILQQYDPSFYSELFIFRSVLEQDDLHLLLEDRNTCLMINDIPAHDQDFHREMKLLRESWGSKHLRLTFALGFSERPDPEYPYTIIEEV